MRMIAGGLSKVKRLVDRRLTILNPMIEAISEMMWPSTLASATRIRSNDRISIRRAPEVPMTPDEETVQRFYQCLVHNDPTGMADCYSEDATFQDMAFRLSGKAEIAAMWRFECSRGLKVKFRDIRTDGDVVSGHWDCDYKFHGTEPVHNEIDSTFTLRDGKILSHIDKASRWAWAKQALGFPKDLVVTVLPVVLRMQAKKELDEFKANERR